MSLQEVTAGAVETQRRRVAAVSASALAAAVVQLRSQRHPTFFVLALVQPAAFLLLAYLAGRHTGRVDVSAAALGSALLALWSSTIWSAGSILRSERAQGTLPAVAARPAGLGPVLVGKSVGATARSAVFIGVSVYAVSLVLGHPVRVERPLLFFAALGAVFVSANALGVLLSCVFVLTRAAPRITEALMYPVFILGGMLIPVTLLPSWVQALSALVSLHWGSRLLNAASSSGAQTAADWLGLTVTTVCYAVAAYAALGRVVRRARLDGSLDLY